MVHLDSLYKTFILGDETITAVNDANLLIESGDMMAVIGPSGSGKSIWMLPSPPSNPSIS